MNAQSPSNPQHNDHAEIFLSGGGEAGALMRAMDWSSTPLGLPETWPQGLRSACGICLGTNYPIAIYWGPELALLYNDAWSEIPGEKHPWALGRAGREVWPEIWDAIGPLFESVQTSGEGVWQEDQLLPMHRHGYTEECYFNFTFSPIRGDSGAVEGIFNAVVETTFRVIGERRERTLRELAERVAAVRTEDEVYGAAVDVLGSNANDIPFCLVYRLQADHVEPQLMGATGLDAPPFDWPVAQLLENKGPLVVENLSEQIGADIPSRVWPEPVERALLAPFGGIAHGGAPAGFIVAGISPRRALDDDYQNFVARAATHIGTAIANVRAFEEERRRAETLAEIDRAKTAFFSNVSHEFRTPLTLMLGPVEDALADPEIPLRERERIEIVHRNGLRLLKLVNSLLDFSRIEAGKTQANLEAVDLAEFTADLASNFRSAMEKAGLSFRVDCRPLSAPVLINRDMWEKIVLNLLSNAFKFTLQGEVAVDLTEQGGMALLSVRDTGSGIAEAEVPKLFERFHRVEGARGRSIEGSGIGLALVQELVRFLGGQVEVKSREGEGTCFMVAIPLDRSGTVPRDATPPSTSTAVRAEAYVEEAMRWLPEGADLRREEEAQTSNAPEGAPRILVADDNADMRDYVRRLLSGTYRVDVVEDGMAALESIRAERPDLLLTDVMMPRLDGIGLIKAIREDARLIDLGVIALSARAGEEERVDGLEVGADDYLVKPFSARELVATVRSNLELAKIRKDATATLQESEARFRNMADHAPVMLWVTDAAGSCTYLNRGWHDFTGQTAEEGLGEGWLSATHPGDRTEAARIFLEANARREPFRIEYRLRRADGEYRWAIDAAAPRFTPEGAFLGYVGSVIDITDRKRTEALQAAQARLLEAAIQEVPLENILVDLVRTVEGFSSSGAFASVLLADEDGRRLRHGAGPNLPAEYNQAIDGVEIGPDVGSCGAAAFRKEPVYVQDIATDPLWKDFRELALSHGLRACWSAPVLSSEGAVLGTFAIYYRQPPSASSADKEMLGFVAGTAALIIERRRAQDALKRQAQRLEGLNRTAGALAGELDLDQLVQTVTDSGVELTGAQFGAFFYNVVDDKGESYMLYTLSGVPRTEFSKFPMPRNTRVFAPTFEGNGVVRSDDITADERYGHNAPHKGMPEGHLPVRSYLAVPVIAPDRSVVGGLFFGHAETRRFTADHEALVEAVAGQAAVAFENARLFKTAQREIEQRRSTEGELEKLNGQLQEMITEAVERAKAAEQALLQSQKMEAIGQLTGGIAHDFNNLLQVVSGNLQLLGKDIAENPAAQRKVANALEGVARGSKLASQLLSFGRRQPLEPKVVNIGRFVAGMEDMLQRTLGEAVEVEIVRGGGLWNTFVDIVQVENAILNLAINARDAMDGSGKLTIEVGNAFLDDAYALEHKDVEPGQYVMLALTDTGSGMPPDLISRVFEPFFTTKPIGKGTGLGLSMVHGFVKQSGGHVKIYSEVGEGTSVKLYFPRSHQQEDVVVVADHGPIVGGTETILVAEDDEKVRETVVAMLTELGYRVLKAKDAAAALTIVESGIPIDLLFTDVVMPGPLKSSEMARQARERMPDLAVLFTSGYTENSIVHGGRLDVGVELLSKPYSREAMARKIRQVLNNAGQTQAAGARPDAGDAPDTQDLHGEEHRTGAGTLRAGNRSRRVLLVEDNDLIRMSEADMLAELGCDVVEAGSAEAALTMLAQGPVDIVVSDLGLPGMSGEEFCREVRRRWPEIAIIFATGMDRGPELNDPRRTALLPKPHGIEELAKALDAVEEGEDPQSS